MRSACDAMESTISILYMSINWTDVKSRHYSRKFAAAPCQDPDNLFLHSLAKHPVSFIYSCHIIYLSGFFRLVLWIFQICQMRQALMKQLSLWDMIKCRWMNSSLDCDVKNLTPQLVNFYYSPSANHPALIRAQCGRISPGSHL